MLQNCQKHIENNVEDSFMMITYDIMRDARSDAGVQRVTVTVVSLISSRRN